MKIEIKCTWHIIIDPDYEYKDKPPFPPKIVVHLHVPWFKYTKICQHSLTATYYYIDEKTYGFWIKNNPDKETCSIIYNNIMQLKKKYHLNFNEEAIFLSIKNLYSDYFRYDHIDTKIDEVIDISKEYINGRLKEQGIAK